jgi:Gas vesicle synthesis protein GvpL/GvpF
MAQEARYIYSIAKMGTRVSLGEIGIEKTEVFTIPYKDIAAVVHSCQPLAYDTKDKALAEEWVLAHSYVIDQAVKKFGSVLPFSFDVILKGEDSAILEWLGKNYSLLLQDLEKVKGKAEYTIQIYYDYDALASRVLLGDAKLMEPEEPDREREQR